MRIKQILDMNRRDFTAIYECEHCGELQNSYGYDDDNFHVNVIPKMVCKKCGKQAAEDYIPNKTKYAAWEVV